MFEAENLRRGLIEAGTRKPDMVILDLGLPDGDGTDFIREVRAWSGRPIVVLSPFFMPTRYGHQGSYLCGEPRVIHRFADPAVVYRQTACRFAFPADQPFSP